VLWLHRQWRVELSGGRSWGKNVIFKEALAEKFFQVPSEDSAVSSLISLAIIEGTIFLCSGEDRILLDWLWIPDPILVFDGIIRESPQSDALFHSEGSEWTR